MRNADSLGVRKKVLILWGLYLSPRSLVAVLSCLLMMLAAAFVPSEATGAESPEPFVVTQGVISWCERERSLRLKDSLSNLSEKEIAEYEGKANAGDAHAMYLLTRLMQAPPEGVRTMPYRQKWFDRALAAAQPLALLDQATQDYMGEILTPERYLQTLERAATEGGGQDEPWQLALLYAGERRLAKGKPVEADPQKARQWAELAVARGSNAATERLCSAYQNGDARLGVVADPAEAVQRCFTAAQASCSDQSAYALSQMFRDGHGLDRNSVEARYWRKIGDERAEWQRKYPGQYKRVAPVRTADQAEALRRYRGRHNLSGGSLSGTRYRSLCEEDRKYRLQDAMSEISESEIKTYEGKAAQGDADAMYFLMQAGRYMSKDQPHPDFREWRTKAASAGHPLAAAEKAAEGGLNSKAAYDKYMPFAEQAAAFDGGTDAAQFISEQYENGVGTVEPYVTFLKADPKKSVYWKKHAAARGDVYSLEQVCIIYNAGSRFRFGIEADQTEAVRWCGVAARAECSSTAAVTMSANYLKGRGMPINYLEARYWSMVWKDRFNWNRANKGEYKKEGVNHE